VTAGEVGGDCDWGGCGSGSFGGLSAVAAVDAGFAGETAGDSTGAAAWVSPRDTEGGTRVGFSATAAGDGFCTTEAGVGFSTSGFDGDV